MSFRIVLSCACVGHASGFSHMAGSCLHGDVQHPPSERAQQGTGDYRIDSNGYVRGDGRIASSVLGIIPYRGVLLQVTREGESIPVGKFMSPSLAGLELKQDCDGSVVQHTYAHTMSSLRARDDVDFVLPSDYYRSGVNLIAKVTVVQSYLVFFAIQAHIYITSKDAIRIGPTVESFATENWQTTKRFENAGDIAPNDALVDGRNSNTELALVVASTNNHPNASLQTDPQPSLLSLQIHGILMLIAWGVSAPLGIFAARYGKSLLGSSQWLRVHRLCLWCSTCLSLGGLGLVFDRLPFFSSSNFYHGKLGVAIVVAALGQLLLANDWMRPTLTSKYRHPWSTFHRWSGRGLVLGAWITCVSGDSLLRLHFHARKESSGVWDLLVILVIGALLVSCLEVLRREVQMRRRSGIVCTVPN